MRLKFLYSKKRDGNAISFYFKPEKKLVWKAGQYLIYYLEHKNKDLRGKMRFFTISSAPFEKNPAITTRFFGKDSSSFKKTLLSLKKGDELESKGPDGDFVIKSANKKYLFIAGGIGITPFYSMLKQLDFERKRIDITLLYQNKHKEFLFKSDLDEIAKNNKKITIIYYSGFKKIDEKVLKKFANKKRLIYISGPDPMVEFVEKELEKLFIPKHNIISDYFSGYKSV